MYGIREDYKYRVQPKTYSPDESRAYWSDYRLDSSRYYQYAVYRRAREIFDTQNYNSVIDIGCGTGFKLQHFFGKTFKRVVGVDQPQAIVWAQKHWNRKIEFIPMNLEAPSDLKEKFDLVICSDVIEHLARPDVVLEWLKQLVTDNGVIVLSTPDRAVLYEGENLGPRNPEHVREWTYGELSTYLKDFGFTIIESGHVPAMRFSLSRMWFSLWRTLGLRRMKHCMYFVCKLRR